MSKKKYAKPEISKGQLEQALLEANLKLQVINKTLKEEEQARNELLSNLSHDLRSPVSALVSAVDYLKAEGFADMPEYAPLIDLMKRRLRTIQSMLDDLFLLTKIECPTIPIKTETVEIGFFLEDFFYSCQADAKYAQRCLSLEIPEPFPYLVQIDTEKIFRVLDNLFLNALLYSSEEASITLKASYQSLSDVKGMVEISVIDTGIGIAPEHIPHLFNRSFRVNSARTPQQGGSGFGLAIAKAIVERHGGSIQCKSRLGEGSIFSFTLPAVL